MIAAMRLTMLAKMPFRTSRTVGVVRVGRCCALVYMVAHRNGTVKRPPPPKAARRLGPGKLQPHFSSLSCITTPANTEFTYSHHLPLCLSSERSSPVSWVCFPGSAMRPCAPRPDDPETNPLVNSLAHDPLLRCRYEYLNPALYPEL